MLTDKIRLSGPETDDPEDYFGSALGVIFPDDITNQHGDLEHHVIYLSPRFGDIHLELADPKGDDNRKLFSHFLWNSGLQLAEFIEEDEKWDVTGQRVLELGAGTGLAGIVAARAGGEEVIITDYPAPEVLANIKTNVTKNVPEELQVSSNGNPPRCWVHGHEWGELEEGDEFVQTNKAGFGRILVADCLWMPWQHKNLMKSICWFLKDEGKAWVIAGFHTGRAKMAPFFDRDALAEHGLEVESIVERDPNGKEREWTFDRGIEDVSERKRWLVISVLRKKPAE
jgi:nicotinamide N-methyltransferase